MLNTYPLWKNALVVIALALGVIYALPNIYPPDFALQISVDDSESVVTESTLARASEALTNAGITVMGAVLETDRGLIRVGSDDDQLRGKEIIEFALHDLPKRHVVALNSAPTTPDWLAGMGAQPMKYGLDLRGGVHFLMEVDTEKTITDRITGLETDVKRQLREENLRYSRVTKDGRELRVYFRDEDKRDDARTLLGASYREFVFATGEDDQYFISLTVTDQAVSEIESFAVSQNIQTIRNRVNELGVAEPLVQKMGRNRIVVDLPGVQDSAEAKRILGKVATLEFHFEATPDAPRSTTMAYDYEGFSAQLERNIILRGERVIDAQVGFDPDSGMPQTNITLDSQGGDMMHRATRNNVGRRLGVLFIETKTRDVLQTIDGVEKLVPQPYVVKRLISLATVQSALPRNFRITGLQAGEARELSLLLRSGALAADMFIAEERTVGASLGEENIRQGSISVVVGLALVLVFMLVYYKVFGLAANIALMSNLVLLVAVMSSLSATLTLPGIAGIVLTVGMAVDANVLIFSRIKEELANGRTPQSAISTGFDRAFVTILDANLTTLLVAVILYSIGTGPIKGFAITLSIGILTSMFTAIIGTRSLINLFYGGRTVTKLAI
jgi:preprotein translocase subunit SecD